MQAINKGLEKVMQELTMAESDGPISDHFRQALKYFLCFSEGEVRSLASLYAAVGRNVDSLILYFGEDPACCQFEQVISTLFNFVKMFKQAHEENCKQLEFEKKKAEKEAAAAEHKMRASDAGHLLILLQIRGSAKLKRIMQKSFYLADELNKDRDEWNFWCYGS